MKFLKPIIALIVIGGLSFWMYTTLQSNKKEIDEKAEVKETVITEIPVRVGLVQNLCCPQGIRNHC